MPRGVYDRSKLKTATKKTETASAAPVAKKAKGKPGRKPGAQVTKSAAAASPEKIVKGSGNQGGNALDLFSTVRENLNTLNALGTQFKDIPTIKTEVEAHVAILADLRKQVFGEEKQEVETEEVEAAAPPSSNGVTASVPFPSVPMPAVPVPSIPTH